MSAKKLEEKTVLARVRSSERVQKLKEQVAIKAALIQGVDAQGCVVLMPGRGERLSLERMRLVTQAYKATEGEPQPIKRAKVLLHLVENMPVTIREGELIVGHHSSASNILEIYPEISLAWLTQALNGGYKDKLTEAEKTEYLELAEYWQGKSMADYVMAVLPARLLDYVNYNGVAWVADIQHLKPREILDFDVMFKIGLNGITDKIKKRLEKIENDETLDTEKYVEQKIYLEAMLIALKAGLTFAQRYAEKARELATVELDEPRKQELYKIAEVCDWVPANPPRTLYEAMQFFHFVILMTKQIELETHGLGNRLDVLFNPYYQKDKAEGRLAREEAQELMACLLLQIADWQSLRSPNWLQQSGGGIGAPKDITIGGVTPEGEDATNEFSFIILDASEACHLPEPTIALRYHAKISPELVSRAIDMIKIGMGYPSIYNDAAYIPWYVSGGYPLEQARNYGISACVGGKITGGNFGGKHTVVGTLNLSKCLEFALYQGKDKERYTGKQLGARTRDLRQAQSIEEVMEAYLEQVRFVVGKIAEIHRIRQVMHEKYVPRPFTSALIDNCIEEGKDVQSRGWPLEPVCVATGLTNVANSLAAIKKLVFDDKVIGMDELMEACRTNFEGKEELRQMLLKAPKYGNDDDYVDRLAGEVHVRTNEALRESRDRFNPISLDGSIAGGYFAASTWCGALPDGKKDNEPAADAMVSPSAGTDTRGPTAVLNSVSKIPYTYSHLLNQKFLPQLLEGENKEKFINYLKTWAELGIGHIQFNMVSRDILLDAQQHPDKYRDLIVRIAGYSAYFVDLSKQLQNDIIRRMEQNL